MNHAEHIRTALHKAALQKERIDLEADEDGVLFEVSVQSSAIFVKSFVSCSHRHMAALVGKWFVHLPYAEQVALIASMRAIVEKDV